jgi:transglutaminase-like putative cysteine protease
MNIFQKIWHSIVSSNDDVYKDIIDSQKEKIKNLNKEVSDLNIEIENIKSESTIKDNLIVQKEAKIDELEDRIEELTAEPEEVESHDIEMKSNDYPYLPNWHVYYYDKDIKTKKIRVTPTKFYKIWSDEMYHKFNNLVKDCKTFDEKVVKIRDYILDIVKYESDAGTENKADNWRIPTETYYGKVGDCDDHAILWIAACKMCGLPADRVFLATGYVKWLGKDAGHAWNIAKFDDGEWYVVDSTSSKVVKLKGSDYKIKGFLRGISNWKFKGVPKHEQF